MESCMIVTLAHCRCMYIILYACMWGGHAVFFALCHHLLLVKVATDQLILRIMGLDPVC